MKRPLWILLGAVALSGAASGPHKVTRDTPALGFNFDWPAEAAAIPKLDLQLYQEAKNALADAQKTARQDQALALEQKRDFNQHMFSMTWTMAGQTARLLSLRSDLGTFTGGAHPNSNYGSLLWDRSLDREIALGALFSNAAQFPRLTRAAYCTKLNAERSKRREGEKFGGDFDQCPKFKELAISPVDQTKNGRFETIDFVASPYVAGPYVEGEYEIELPVTSALIRAMKPEYRGSFEAQRQ